MKKLTALLLALMMLLALAAGCSNNTDEPEKGTQNEQQSQTDNKPEDEKEETPEAPKRDSMIIAQVADVGSLDPYIASQSQEFSITFSLFDSLTLQVPGEGEPHMRIASEYTQSDDGLSFLFTLRDDVYFHNGEKMTMDDVLYSFEQFRTAPVTMSFSAAISNVEAVGDNQIRVDIAAPTPKPVFFENLNWMAIIPKAAHEAAGGDFGTSPVGSGAYQVTGHEPGVETHLGVFEQYYMEQPQIKNLTFKVIPDTSTIAVALQTGEIDYSKSLPFTAIPEIEESDSVDFGIRTSMSLTYAFYDTTVAPFDNKLVRQAFNYALDKEMCNIVKFEGYGRIAYSPFSPDVFGYSEEVTGYSQDVEKAKALLAEAGYPNGEGMPALQLQCLEIHNDLAQVLQENLRMIGVAVEIQVMEQNAFLADALSGSVPFGMIGVGIGSDASVWGDLMLKSGTQFNFAHYENAELDALFDQAFAERDSDKRLELYIEAQKILEEEAYWMPIQFLSQCHAWAADIEVDNALHMGGNTLQPYYVTCK